MFTFPLLQGAPEEWARKNFAGCPVGESRRRRRAVKIAARMAQRPGQSIPQRFDSFYAVKAADTFFDRAETAPDRLQAVHRRKAREQLGVAGRTYLLLEDTSELSWPGNQPLPGLGPVGAGAEGLQGFLLHSTLAVAWPREPRPAAPRGREAVEVLGLADPIDHRRQPRPSGERKGDQRLRQRRERESQLWEQATARLGSPQAGVRWERVCDAGADIYEFLRSCAAAGHGYTDVAGTIQNRARLV